MINSVTIALIFIACMTYICTAHALKDHSFFSFPRTLAASVSVLVFISLSSLGEGWILALLAPFGALGLSLLILILLNPSTLKNLKK